MQPSLIDTLHGIYWLSLYGVRNLTSVTVVYLSSFLHLPVLCQLYLYYNQIYYEMILQPKANKHIYILMIIPTIGPRMHWVLQSLESDSSLIGLGFLVYFLLYPSHYWNLIPDFSQMSYGVQLRSAFSGGSNIRMRPGFTPEKDGKFGGEREAICLSYLLPITSLEDS